MLGHQDTKTQGKEKIFVLEIDKSVSSTFCILISTSCLGAFVAKYKHR